MERKIKAIMAKRIEDGYSVKVVDTLYKQLPAFTDVFDEDTFYTFVLCFISGTIVLVFILSRFVTLRPVDW